MALFLSLALGAIFGSFVAASSWRAPQGITIVKGRSFCPHCKHRIAWYDNLPLWSFIYLKGKCRHCQKRISWRYPAIEFSGALIFGFSSQYFSQVLKNIPWLFDLGILALPLFLVLSLIMLFILVVDLEKKLILDGAVFLGMAISLIAHLASESELYLFLLAGFTSALFLLLVHLVTSGRGMGLGDVKFVLLAGIILGPLGSFLFLFGGFLTGAVVGVILILAKRASFGREIAFGPFLVISFFLISFWGKEIMNLWF